VPIQPTSTPNLSNTLIPLLRGLIDRTVEPQRWHDLLTLQAPVRDQLRILGLELVIDEAEGYAFVRQRAVAEGEPELPRLVPRRQLTFSVSLLLVLLRRRMVEHDSASGDRLIVTRDEIAEMLRVFLPDTADEQRYLKRLDQYLTQIVNLGFIRALRDRDDEYEVRRILRAFVDGQWLQEFASRLEAYRGHAADADVDAT
jgi:hypothetical protein